MMGYPPLSLKDGILRSYQLSNKLGACQNDIMLDRGNIQNGILRGASTILEVDECTVCLLSSLTDAIVRKRQFSLSLNLMPR
ncbi:hypothetical protein MTBPR1_50002 [Candidatus Terasakiella magnetica]|uniref:Uncharacterized protein n=1 Tax=Candidatus Terasakiella magnetica TaxID=1867952 RepID=A0A1C3RJ06_9PROT|nr:hypothetical protein MTBPR1_50002 [Candidatus Terasakiella magnetica]